MKILIGLVLLACIFVSGAAYSQVVICDTPTAEGKNYAACTAKHEAQKPEGLVAWCYDGADRFAPVTACRTTIWLASGAVEPYTEILTVQGWQSAGELQFPEPSPPPPPPPPPPTAYVPPSPPVCTFLQMEGRTIRITGTGFVAGGHCKRKFWYQTRVVAGDLANLSPNFADVFTWDLTQIANAWNAHVTRDYTDAERVIANEIYAAKPQAPVWWVAKNGTSNSRPTYPTSDGVRITRTNGRVELPNKCGCIALAIDSVSVYCSVAGLPNVATAAVDVLPEGTVALCTP